MVETNKRNKVATSKKSILFLIENTVKKIDTIKDTRDPMSALLMFIIKYNNTLYFISQK